MMATLSKIGRVVVGVVLLSGVTANTAFAQTAETLQVSTNSAAQEILRQAESLLSRNDSEAAFALLSPLETQLAGNAYYDYLLGVAALDTGRTSEAIFSLRRSLAVEPRFSGARMELARAYYEAGNPEVARPLFVSLLNDQPPPGVREVLEQYLRAIDAKPGRPQSRFSPYADLFVGHDSNANGSTSDQQFMGFMLAPENLETDSPFVEIGAGMDWLIPRSTQLAWQLGARVGYRNNPDASFVDSAIVSGFAGINWRRSDYFGRAGIDAFWASRDGEFNESYGGVDVSVGRRLSDRWDLSLGLRTGVLGHDDNIDVLDVNRTLYTLSGSYRFSPLARLTIEAIGGNDSAQNSGSPYGNSKAGARISLSAPVAASAQLFASLGNLSSDYDDLFFGVARKDSQFTSMLQIEFRDVLTPGLSILPRLRYINNDSDVSLYKYDRTEIGLMFRWIPR